jgi:hypothetical protein
VYAARSLAAQHARYVYVIHTPLCLGLQRSFHTCHSRERGHMAQSDWGEVCRLAADLQRLQQSSTAHRLTERNCIELVATLVKRNLLELVYTLDGKEYVTPDQLVRDIKDELVVHGGNNPFPL